MACAFAHRVVAGAVTGIAVGYKESQTGESHRLAVCGRSVRCVTRHTPRHP
jgi:hypothetical protein